MLLFEKLKEKKIDVILIIILSLVIGIICAVTLAAEEYIASSTFLLVETEKVSDEEIQNIGNLEISSKLLATLEEIMQSDTTASKIKSELGLQIANTEISKNVTMKLNSKTDTIELKNKNLDEKNAIDVNRKLLETFSIQLKGMNNKADIYVIDDSHILKTVSSIPMVLSVILSIIFGSIISILYVVIILIIEKNIRINKNIEKEIDLKKLIDVPLRTEKRNKLVKSELISYESQKSLTSKAFKNLRSNIQFITVNDVEKKIILVTSPSKSEGKSYISANVATSFAEAGKKVILIDADMATGRQSEIFNIPNNLGLSNYLSNLDSNGIEIKKLANNFINETAIKNLNLITAGTIPPNTTELLSSQRLSELIKDLSIFYDIVIIDGTPVITSMDSLILTRLASSTILVSDYKKTKKEDILKAKRDIQNVGGKLIGIVVNRAKVKKEKISFEEIGNVIKAFLIYLKRNIVEIINIIKEKRAQKKQRLLMEATIKEEIKKQAKLIKENDLTNQEIEEPHNENEEKEVVAGDESEHEEKHEDKIEEVTNEEKELIILENMSKDKKIFVLMGKAKDFIIVVAQNTKSVVIKITQKVKPIIKKSFKNMATITLIGAQKIKSITIKGFKSLKAGTLKIISITKNKGSKLISDIKNKLKERKEKKNNSYDNQLTFDNIEIHESTPKEEVASKETSVVKEELETINEIEIDKKVIDIVEQLPKRVKQSNTEKTQKDIKKEDNVKTESKKIKKLEFTDPELQKGDNAVLVIVDAEKGCCRVFGKCYYTEKLIRGIDKNDGFNKNQYSSKLINARITGLINLYGLTKKQAQRVDALIYTTLCDYDDRVWIDKKTISNRADTYVLSMSKESIKLPQESKEEYLIRCKRLRQEALQEAEIDIEYKLDNIWKSDKLSFLNKLTMKRYADIYQVKESQKNYEEIEKSNQNKDFYVDIIQKVKNKIESNIYVEEEDNGEETENTGVYEVEEGEEKFSEIAWKKEEKQRRKEERRERFREKIREKKQLLLERKEEAAQKKQEKNRKQEELKRKREEEKERLREEARIEEELLGDNLYPKTKNNRSLQ